MAFALIFSCMASVLWTPLERLIGRGVEIRNLSKESPLIKAEFREGDTLLRANKRRLKTPEDLLDEIELSGTPEIRYYRDGYYWQREAKKSDLLDGNTALEKLGVGSWNRSHSWRSSGFYGHYATYAEVLQLIASLALGLLVGGLWTSSRRAEANDREASTEGGVERSWAGLNITPMSIVLFICIGLIGFALLLTLTRASQAALMVSAFAIVSLGAGRKIFLALLIIAVPIAIIAVVYLQQSRNVGFFDAKDESTIWRQTVYREGFSLWKKNVRNFTVGVGMDSIKRYAKEWRLFDDGRLPMGHFHSTPLQLLVERGFPALLLWLWIFGLYLLKLFKALRSDQFDDWKERGIVLGCFGGALGFFVSGLVHYNLGDGEVAMVFYLLMAFSVTIVMRNDGL